MIRIDLATELGESFALPPLGVPLSALEKITLDDGEKLHPRHLARRADADLSDVISSVHLACGFHSGDPLVMRRVAISLGARGVRLGAHPSYPDMFGFAQKSVALSREEITALLAYQLGGLRSVLAGSGQRLTHVKCHGALYFDVARGGRACEALIDAVQKIDPSLQILVAAGSFGLERVARAGLDAIAEAYADRGYGPDGRILPRSNPQALITDPHQAADQVISIVRDHCVPVAGGKTCPLEAQSVCFHADTPNADAFAHTIRTRLEEAGITVAPPPPSAEK